tara:strand:- start:594 stop:836 length:243 start_codon:yes stop_codon:yes gene_type:complete
MLIKIYGVSDCPACFKAQAIVMGAYPKYEYVYINMDFAESFRDELKNKFKYKSYPIITVVDKDDEKLIGGTEHLQIFMSD